ncbi:MAG: hypothetical protein VX589_11875 [Myxococcota bacterium]|nr:hypothetical protein [Myxococcota bacterium]
MSVSEALMTPLRNCVLSSKKSPQDSDAIMYTLDFACGNGGLLDRYITDAPSAHHLTKKPHFLFSHASMDALSVRGKHAREVRTRRTIALASRPVCPGRCAWCSVAKRGPVRSSQAVWTRLGRGMGGAHPA